MTNAFGYYARRAFGLTGEGVREAGVGWVTLEGPYSAEWKLLFAIRDLLCSIFRDLHDSHALAPHRSQRVFFLISFRKAFVTFWIYM